VNIVSHEHGFPFSTVQHRAVSPKMIFGVFVATVRNSRSRSEELVEGVISMIHARFDFASVNNNADVFLRAERALSG